MKNKSKKLTNYDYQRIVDVWLENGKSIKKTAEQLNLGIDAVRYRLKQAKEKNFVARLDNKNKNYTKNVFVITAAQDDTPVFEDFWENLNAYVNFRDAELIIGGFTYQKGLFEDHSSAAAVYDNRLTPYLLAEHRYLSPKLVYLGGANILPTAANPIGGWETMTGDAWAIIPHSRISLKSVPTMLEEEAKIIMTTGVVTEPNYVQRATGQKSEFHHTFGAVVVEIEDGGTFHCRHINATKDGSFQDLDLIVRHGFVTADNRVEAINWGDIHHARLEADMEDACWHEEESLALSLHPKHQFIHDLLDFKVRNHHNRDNSHFRAKMYMNNSESVEDEIKECGIFLEDISLTDCETVVIESNHDTALHRWLEDIEAVKDPANVKVWHDFNSILLSELNNPMFNLLEYLLNEFNIVATFVAEGQSFKICENTDSAIECGLHGHVGTNGARGSPLNLSKVASKLNIGHVHSASIINGVYTAGVTASLKMGYNERGPSSWSHTHIITYPNGKRTLITMKRNSKGKLSWRI